MNSDILKQEVLKGKIFIYPTDTIYGIGCDALNKNAVDKIRQIKRRDEKPFSVIAPNFEWIHENCIVDFDLKKYLPGAYTLILKKKNPSFLNWVSDKETLGVRIPNHNFTKEIQKTNVPFITTSVNFSGEKPASKIENISEEILNKVDYVIDEG
ncbi:MAG: L-threonylcarbamoyladenylate synthase, partial [Nanoarchaeota archaeon]